MPASAKGLPDADRIPNGVAYFSRRTFSASSAAARAQSGYYRAGDKRWRDLSAARDNDDQAKRFDPHALRVKSPPARTADRVDLGSRRRRRARPILQPSPERAKIEWVFARKGPHLVGVGDEEARAQDAAHLTKD